MQAACELLRKPARSCFTCRHGLWAAGWGSHVAGPLGAAPGAPTNRQDSCNLPNLRVPEKERQPGSWRGRQLLDQPSKPAPAGAVMVPARALLAVAFLASTATSIPSEPHLRWAWEQYACMQHWCFKGSSQPCVPGCGASAHAHTCMLTLTAVWRSCMQHVR